MIYNKYPHAVNIDFPAFTDCSDLYAWCHIHAPVFNTFSVPFIGDDDTIKKRITVEFDDPVIAIQFKLKFI